MERQYVGIDLHRRRSVIVRVSEDGEKLSTVKIANDPIALSLAIAAAGPDPEVVFQATYGWYWAVDVLRAEGASVHLAHPQALNWTQRRVKNDELDATELANRRRRHDLPEGWIAPPPVRELRELVRYRALRRYRHRARYDEDRIMPRKRRRAFAGAVIGTTSSA